MSSSQDAGQRGDRLTNLELLYMHLERQVAELNRIVHEQGGQIERLERELRRRDNEAALDEAEPADDRPGGEAE